MIKQVEIMLLGTFQVRVNGRPVRLGQPKQRALLALLALRHGTAVPVADITDALWGYAPPKRARNQIQVYVAAVRRLFAEAEPPHHPITTLPGAYQLDIPPHGVDLTAFEMLADRAGRLAAAGRLRAADQALAGALAMWSGPALGGLVGEYFQRAAVRLEERRIAVLEQHVGVKLALDDEGVLMPALRSAVAAHPLCEGLRHGLMVALYRAGRPAEALAVYRDGRRSMIDELGIEPGRRLRSLERHILRGEPWCPRAAADR